MKSIILSFCILCCSCLLAQPESFTDREQKRIDLLDGVSDASVNLGSADFNAKSHLVYFQMIDSLEQLINQGAFSEAEKRNLNGYVYSFLKKIGPKNVLLISFQEKLIRQMQGIIFAKMTNALSNELYKNIPASVKLINLYKDDPSALPFLMQASKSFPDDVLKMYADYAEMSWAPSLISFTARQSPLSVKRYLLANHPIRNIIFSSNDTACKAISQIYNAYGVKSGAYALIDPIVTGKLSIIKADSIAKMPVPYLRQLYCARKNPDAIAGKTIDDELERLSLEISREINNLHDVSDPKIRFAVAEKLSSYDLYTVMVYSQDEIFTSTFLGLFDRMMTRLKPNKGDMLLDSLGYNHFRSFIKLCAGFNTLNTFLTSMNPAQRNTMLANFVSNLDAEKGNLSDAVNVADAIGSIQDSNALYVLEKTLITEYQRVSNSVNPEGKTIYGLLIHLFQDKSKTYKADFIRISRSYPLPAIDRLPNASLLNAKSQNIQAHFFFDDDDGKASFASFIETFTKAGWSIDKTGYVVKITSKNNKVIILANTPESEELGGQEAILAYLDSNGLQPQMVVHRGHSYYNSKTIDKIGISTGIAFMGSCGSYNRLTDIIDRSPDIHIIATKQIGTMFVNNPLILLLATQISQGKDIVWAEFWKELSEKVKASPGAKDRFDDYIPPYKNLGAIFLQAYRNALQ